MTDTKTSDEINGDPALAADVVRVARETSPGVWVNRGLTAQSLADLGGGGSSVTVPITTSGTPTDFDPNAYPNAAKIVLAVTTGGTNGDEFLNILDYTFTLGDPSAFAHPPSNGTRIVIEVVSLAGSDTVQVTVSGGDTIYARDATGRQNLASPTADDTRVPLNYEGASTAFIWADYLWNWDNTSNNNGEQPTLLIDQLPPLPTDADDKKILKGQPGGAEWIYCVANPYIALEVVTNGATPTPIPIKAAPAFLITTSGSAGPEEVGLSGESFLENDWLQGRKINIVLYAPGDPADTVSLLTTAVGGVVNFTIKTAAGAGIDTIVFSNIRDNLVLEQYSMLEWRVYSGTAVVTPL